MKKTVILSPYKKDFSGTATMYDGIAKFTVNHPGSARGQCLKLYVMSTSRATLVPEAVCTINIFGNSTEFETDTARSDDVLKGCRPDTFLITLTSDGREEAVLAAFFGLEWNAARFLEGRLPEVREEKCDFSDKTISNAQKLLEDMKSKKTVSAEKINAYIDEYKGNIGKYEKCSDLSAEGFEWYKIPGERPVSCLSAVKHILNTKNARAIIEQAGHYVAGIKKDDGRHIAIGIPACPNNCPMPQLSDCCCYEEGYHIAGIYLSEEGQYFEKYLQK